MSNILLKVVMLHIKFKAMEHRAPCKKISSTPRGGQQVKTVFSESSLVAYQIKVNGA